MAMLNELLLDGFSRVHDTVGTVVDGLSEQQLTARVGPDANTIGWLVWHLARVQDDHVADLAGTDQVWTGGGFASRFGFPFDTGAVGYGFDSDEVAQVRGVSAADLKAYGDAVHEATVAYVRDIDADELQRIVDDSWDPPVTVAVRLVSVLSDDLQHVGQAGYVRGLLGRGS